MPAIARENPANRIQSDKAKSLTIEVIQDVQKGKWDAAQNKVAQSKDPLATKIYHWLLLLNTKKKDWTNEMFIRLSHFIRQNPEWPEISKMKKRAEGVMPVNLSNAEVLAWYNDFPPKTVYGTERYIDALLIEGKREKAQKMIANWWAKTLVSKSEQNKIFQNYGGYLTLDAHKSRFDALLRHNHYESAIAIANVLGQGYPALAQARIALAKGQNDGVSALINKVPSYLEDDPGLLYERLHWRRTRKLNDRAIEILLNAPDNIQNHKKWWTERHIIIRRVMEQGDYKLAYKLAAGHKQKEGFSYAQAQWLAGWLALRFMNKPTQGYERFSALYDKVSTPVSKARAAYWAGRAANGLRQHELARTWYKKAAEFKTVYYGQLASAALSLKDKLPEKKSPQISRSERQNFDKNELVQAYFIFDAADKKREARRFLEAFLAQNATPKGYRYMAERLAKKGDFYGAVRVAKKASSKGLFLTKQSYPTITKHLTHINTAEWALIHALIRQESMFDYTAKSHAGARGLMQLMPATAKEVSKRAGQPYNKAWLTERPDYNMMLGAKYISEMLKRYNNYPLAIAAYNAGPGRVDKWLEIYGDPREDVNMLDWIEMIPIYETRNYVQRVMENTYVYRLMLEGIQLQPKSELYVAFHTKP